MTIKAFIFDFDGLILDTETPEFEAWQEIFKQYNFGLPLSEWQKTLGTSRQEFDPPTYLEELIGHPINKKMIEHDHKIIALEKITLLEALPGVEKLLASAREKGIKLAVASSSSTDWVWCHLARLKLAKYFDTICGGNEVPAVKPDPALFQLALNELQVEPGKLSFLKILLMDHRGQNAGIFCIAVPNPISKQLSIDHANLVLRSLEDTSVDELLALAK